MKNRTLLTMVLGMILIATTTTAFAINDNTVQLFNNKNFDAPSGNITYDLPPGENEKLIYSFEGGFGNDVLSSVKVGKGVKVTLYKDAGMNGDKLVLYPGEYKDFSMDFGDNPWNDKVSSLKIQRLSDPNLPLIKLTYYSGFTQMIGLDGVDEFKADWCLLRDNDVQFAEIPPEYKVTFYDNFRYEGNSNKEPIKGGNGVKASMDSLGLKRSVSSIKIEWNKFKLTKVEMVKTSTKAKELDTFSMPMGADAECHNNSTNSTMTCKKQLKSTYNATATTNWQNSTTVGVTATTTIKGTAGVEGVASSSVEASLALSVANEFAFGKTEARSQGQEVSDEVEIEVPPGGAVGFTLDVKPVEIEYDVTYTYSSVDDNGTPDGKGADKVIKGKMNVKSATATTAVSRDIKPGNVQPAQPEAPKGFGTKIYEFFAAFPEKAAEFFKWLAGSSGSNSNTNTNTNTSSNVNPSSVTSKSNAAKIVGSWKGEDDTLTFHEDKNMSSLLGNKKYKYTYEVVNENTVQFTITDPKQNSVISIQEATIAFENGDNTLVWTAGETTLRLNKVNPL